MAQTTNTHTVTFGDGNTNCGNIDNSVNTTVYDSDQDTRIMHWLSPLEPENRHDGVRSKRFEGVGNWLLERSEFREWSGGQGGADKALLFCFGDPGVGKTHLSSLVIDSLCDQAREEEIVVAWLYCDYNAQQEQTVINMMGAILKRLVGREIPNDIRKGFREGRRPLLADLVRMLKIAIDSLPQVFICIDALDECLPKDLPELLGLLGDIVRESPRTRIFFTGRSHVNEAVRRYFPNAVAISVSPNQDDIRNYLEMGLDRDDEPEAMNNDLRAEIVTTIVEKMSNVFLLVSLNIEAILGEVTISQRREKLEEMARGNGLSDAYTATLTRLKAQKGNKSQLGLKVLMWVLYSQEPLEAEELCHALGVRMGSTDLDVENIPALWTLVSSCVGLVTVEASSSTVRLVHFTLKEHLISDPTLFHSPHSTIAEVCLTYLNFESVRDLPPTGDTDVSTMHLLEYASVYWGEHARRGITENVKILALRLLDRFDEHVSVLELLWNSSRHIYLDAFMRRGEEGPRGFTGLHGAAFLGIVEILTPLLDTKKWDVNAIDFTGNTALTWAARRGQEEVIKVLLKRMDVNPNQADTEDGRTPLAWAIQRGHEGIVKILLERKDVNPNKGETGGGWTPLFLAAKGEHEGILRILLQRKDINPDDIDTKCGQTLLSWAAQRGQKGVVKMLLEREDVNPNRADASGQTPLGWAALGGHEGIVKVLLERKDINPDPAGAEYGRTPLSLAAERGHKGVVKMLLEREDVNPDRADGSGRTPLSWAASEGHEGIVKMLLDEEGMSPDRADESGRTPLGWAALESHEGIVKMLLERGDINPERADESGQTPLSWAVVGGHEGIIKMLLGREDVNPDRADESGQTPLSWAASRGHDGIVKMLLEREDVNPNRPDESGKTPLSWAASEGDEGILKLLLGRKDVNPDHADTEYGRTPLSWAARRGHEGVVKMLLERDDVNPDRGDESGKTPLGWAVVGGHEGIIKMLLGREDVNPDLADESGLTPLSWAVVGGHEGIVKMLLGREDVNPDQVDKSGKTPLSWAASEGHKEIFKMLAQRKDVDPDRADTEYGRTPLSWAARRGHEGVVKMLLERDDVNPDRGDESGKTPLSWAASGGHEEIVRLLLERKYANPNQADPDGLTPLPLAAEGGHDDVVDVSLEWNDVCPAILDHENQPPPSLAPPNGYQAVSRTLLEQGDVDSDKANHAHASLLPSDRPANEFVEMQFSSHDPNIDITNSVSQPKPTQAAHRERLRLPNLQGSVSKSAAHHTSTCPSWWSRISRIRPRKLFRRLIKTKTDINNH